MPTNRPANQRTGLQRQVVISICIVVALTAAGFVLTRRAVSEPRDAAPPSLNDAVTLSRRGEEITGIELSRVTSQALDTEIRATGQVLYPADGTVRISPRLQGRVKSVSVKVGDRVIPGQVLAVLDSVDAAAAQNTARQNENKLRMATLTLERSERLYKLGTPEVAAAQATRDQAHAAMVAAKDALDRTKQQAAIGGFTQPPVETAQTSVIAARGALVQAQSDLAQAQRDRDRKAKLVEIGVAARSDLDAADNVLEKSRAAVQADLESVKLTEQALSREKKAFTANMYAEQQIRTAEAAYRQALLQESAADRALRLARAAMLANLQQARSDLQAAQTDAENSRRVLDLLGNPGLDGTVRVVSPMAGTVTDRQVSAGQIVDQSQMTPWQMFVISDTARVWIDADVYEKDIASIVVGQPVTIAVSAYPDKRFRGTVLRIAPALDKTTRAVKVRAEIPNRDALLKDGMFASVTIYPRRGRQSLLVPASAVQHDGDSDYVFVPEGRKYVRRRIEIGAHVKNLCTVVEGLREGEAVVSHGAIFLDNQANGS